MQCDMNVRQEQLSDAQVDALNQDPEVKEARTRFLQESAKAYRAKDQTAIDEAKKLEAGYFRIFRARLEQVIENPPEPRTSKVVKDLRGSGFGNHA